MTENVLGVGNYCYVASARRRWGAHGGGSGGEYRVATRTACYLCVCLSMFLCIFIVIREINLATTMMVNRQLNKIEKTASLAEQMLNACADH